jgi:hypothetical protein
MRCSIAQQKQQPVRWASVLVLATASACAAPDASPHDAPTGAGGIAAGGSGGASSLGGSGGQSAPGGSGGAGAGGDANGGAAGDTGGAAGGSGGAGSGGSSGEDAGPGRDATIRADAAGSGGTGGAVGVDGGGVTCDDISSPERLAVYYYSNSAASGSSIQMYFDVVNFTAFSARLAQVTVRYWFTDEDASSPNLLEQYYVPLPTTMKFTTLDPPRQGADTVLEISFTTAGDAGGTFVETRGFNFAFHKNGYSGTYDQTNDYSYAPDLKTSLGQNPKITAYINGALAWGCEPPIP